MYTVIASRATEYEPGVPAQRFWAAVFPGRGARRVAGAARDSQGRGPRVRETGSAPTQLPSVRKPSPTPPL